MSRKQRLPKARRFVELRLWQLDVSELLDFQAAWFPQRPQDPPGLERPWTTWSEFLGAYGQIRDELLESCQDRSLPIFGERVRDFVASYGVAELDTIDSYDWLKVYLDQHEAGVYVRAADEPA